MRQKAAKSSKKGLPAGQIGDMDEGIVEGGENVTDAENVLTFLCLRSKDHILLLFLGLSLSRSHPGSLNVRNWKLSRSTRTAVTPEKGDPKTFQTGNAKVFLILHK